jgi:hypothetical protein
LDASHNKNFSTMTHNARSGLGQHTSCNVIIEHTSSGAKYQIESKLDLKF